MSQPPNVTVRDLNWRDYVRKVAGEEFGLPDVAYEFSNKRKFESTDNSEHGVYKRS